MSGSAALATRAWLGTRLLASEAVTCAAPTSIAKTGANLIVCRRKRRAGSLAEAWPIVRLLTTEIAGLSAPPGPARMQTNTRPLFSIGKTGPWKWARFSGGGSRTQTRPSRRSVLPWQRRSERMQRPIGPPLRPDRPALSLAAGDTYPRSLSRLSSSSRSKSNMSNRSPMAGMLRGM